MLTQATFGSAVELAKFVNGQYPITAVDIVADKVTLLGNLVGILVPTNTFDISGSTGNDGIWTVSSITHTHPFTEIEVVEDLTNAVADGLAQTDAVLQVNIVRIEERGGTWFLLYWSP